MNEKSKFFIRPIKDGDHAWIKKFIKEQWADNFIVVHDMIYYPHELEGFVAVEPSGSRVGLITYSIQNQNCEIVTLNSIKERIGIGTGLMKSVHNSAMDSGCSKVWLITTNDNKHAINFYQKLGYKLVTIHKNAIAKSRKLKPAIPLFSGDKIPIRDELEFEYLLKSGPNNAFL